MNKREQRSFYIVTRLLRDLDDEGIDLILKAEGLSVKSASIDECKKAVIKYQLLSSDEDPVWETDWGRLRYANRL